VNKKQRVAQLHGMGLLNSEIAAEMSIKPKAVAEHLRHLGLVANGFGRASKWRTRRLREKQDALNAISKQLMQLSDPVAERAAEHLRTAAIEVSMAADKLEGLG
jgi:predicted transcriptional regulator